MSELYDGKYFYEVVATDKPNEKLLVGPFDNIYYTVKKDDGSNEYPFVQVIDGKPVQAFLESEILVLDRKL